MEITLIVLLVVFAYLLGSIATAVIACNLMGLPDPRTEGSQNPGATNVMKIGGKKAALITLIGDLLKGLVPVLIGVALEADELTLSLIALAAFLGHLYPLFHGFKGGKGVATAFGVILGLSWPVGIVTLLTWLSVYYLFKLSSLAALVTALLTPVYFYIIDGSATYTVLAGLLAAMLILRHRSNIEKIIAGTED